MPRRNRKKGKHGEHRDAGKHKSKMPANVLAYFKYRSAGMSKEKAKKRAGL